MGPALLFYAQAMKQLDSRTFVSGQIAADDVPGLAASGISLIINNRPDGEEPDQPPAAGIEAAAQASGIGYRHIPMAGGLNAGQVEEMAAALAGADGATLAFCRSGTRSAYLWALARSRMGEDGDALTEKAAAAGYDLTPVRRFL